MNPLPKASTDTWPEILWKIILTKEFNFPYDVPEFLTFPAISRISVSAPQYFRGFLRRSAEMEYGSRIKPFGFLIGAHVARFGHPEGVDPKHFHLLAAYTANPADWDRQFWTDAYSGREFAITTGLSYQPGVVRVRSYGDMLEEFIAHGEVKSATPNGEPAGPGSRGLLIRRHVSPSEIRLIGKESNCLEMVEAGLLGDLGEILSSYDLVNGRPPSERLMSESATTLAKAWKVSVRTVRAWRRKAREASG